VIPTSTNVNIKGVDVSKIDDDYFRRTEATRRKNE
jgi:large subunit ribosomal protein L6e